MLNDKVIVVGAEVLGLAVPRVEGLKRIAFCTSLRRPASFLTSACTWVRDTLHCARTDSRVRERVECGGVRVETGAVWGQGEAGGRVVFAALGGSQY